jgi:hypothetical protein
MILRKLGHYTSIIILGWMVWLTPSHSAEIRCATVWSVQGLQNAPPQKIEQMYQRRFPSGRRPIPGTTCVAGVLSGAIVQGDEERFVRFYRANHPFLDNFLLISPGGNVDAAINIGRLFRKYLIEALAPVLVSPGVQGRPWGDASGQIVEWCNSQDCICASACALIWFGAIDREGLVGLHRPSTDDPAFKALSPADASISYRRILGSITAYLEEMEVPKPMMDAMVSTSSSEIRWVDGDKIGLKRPPSIAEWEDASCGSFTREEWDAYSALAVKQVDRKSSPQEQMFLKVLADKLDKHNSCISLLLSAQRDRLASP